MSDTSINQIIQYGTAAARAVYVPAPPAGIKTLYIWYDTDSAPDTFVWNGAAWVQINVGAGLGITALTGDATATGPGSVTLTLANTAVTPGTYGDATNVSQITVDSKGRITAAADVPITTGIDQLTGDITAGPGSGSEAATIPGLAMVDDGNSGTTKTIDFLSLKVGRHEFTLTGNVVLTLSNPVDGGVYVILIHTGAGGFTATWPGSVLWPGGTGPTITATASKTDLVTLIYDSSATKYYGSFNQNY